MSDATAVFLMLGTYVAIYLVGMYVTKMVNDRMDEIIVGVVQGLAVPREHRSTMFYNQWMPMMSGLAASSAVFALGYFQIAAQVSSDGLRLFAYLLTALFGWSFAMYLLQGVSTGLKCWSLLRQAERD